MVEFRSERLLPWSGVIPSNEEVIRKLVDEAYIAALEMIRTHLIYDKLRFIHAVRAIEAQGYRVVWFKHKGTIGATRQGASPIMGSNTTGGNNAVNPSNGTGN